MRTTLAIDDDILHAARAIAQMRRTSVGAVVSDLVRRSLEQPAVEIRNNGIPRLPITNPRAIVTLEIVNALRDESP